MTFRQSLARSFRNMCFFVSALCCLVAFGMSTAEKPAPLDKPVPANSLNAVMERVGDCPQAAKGEFPGVMVYQVFNGGTFLTMDTTMIGKGIDSEFGGKAWKGHRVIKFCK